MSAESTLTLPQLPDSLMCSVELAHKNLKHAIEAFEIQLYEGRRESFDIEGKSQELDIVKSLQRVESSYALLIKEGANAMLEASRPRPTMISTIGALGKKKSSARRLCNDVSSGDIRSMLAAKVSDVAYLRDLEQGVHRAAQRHDASQSSAEFFRGIEASTARSVGGCRRAFELSVLMSVSRKQYLSPRSVAKSVNASPYKDAEKVEDFVRYIESSKQVVQLLHRSASKAPAQDIVENLVCARKELLEAVEDGKKWLASYVGDREVPIQKASRKELFLKRPDVEPLARRLRSLTKAYQAGDLRDGEYGLEKRLASERILEKWKSHTIQGSLSKALRNQSTLLSQDLDRKALGSVLQRELKSADRALKECDSRDLEPYRRCQGKSSASGRSLATREEQGIEGFF